MKKFSLFCSILLLAFIANGQHTKKISLTVIAAMNTAHYSLPKQYGYTDRTINTGNVQHFKTGILVGMPLCKHTVIETGLLLNGKGGQTEANKPYYLWEHSQTKSLYLEVPINMVYTIKISRSFNLFTGAGMYMAMGIGGSNRYDGLYGDIYPMFVSETAAVHYQNEASNSIDGGAYGTLKKWDYGFNFLGGIRFKKVQLFCNYALGLKDVNPSSDKKDSMGKNRVFSYGIGYTFLL